jgi:hypothetical protein
MRTPEEIKNRKLKLYDSREKFVRIIADKKPDNEFTLAACQVIEQTYSALITELDWVLNED